jgi:hypothetical protein
MVYSYCLGSKNLNLHKKNILDKLTWLVSTVFTIKYSQGQARGSCTEETGEREGRVGVICDSDLRRHVFIGIVCSNAVGKLAFMALNMWMGVNWEGRGHFMLKLFTWTGKFLRRVCWEDVIFSPLWKYFKHNPLYTFTVERQCIKWLQSLLHAEMYKASHLLSKVKWKYMHCQSWIKK